MPRIFINEKDRTSPGAPNSYSNYSVLVAGFRKLVVNELSDGVAVPLDFADSKADANGVYEFSSVQAFKDIIGLVAPKSSQNFEGGVVENYHYGNQMAYELLNMGYSVIYAPIEKLSDLMDATFWERFKDRSNYDFRFVTHGLLESTNTQHDREYQNQLDALEATQKALADLREEVEAAENYNDLPEDDKQQALEDAYSSLFNEHRYANLDTYTSFGDTEEGLGAEHGIAAELETLKQTFEGIDRITKAQINEVNGYIANLAKYVANAESEDPTGRGDCIALIEVDEHAYTATQSVKNHPEINIIEAINEMSQINGDNGKYCAMTVPSVYYKMSVDPENPNEFGNNTKFPGAFHYLACFINSLNQGFAEWYATAGYTRGVSSYIVENTSVKLGEIAINALEPRNLVENGPKFACNVIANFRGSYYLWGNRTAHPLGEKGNLVNGDLVASSFLNIRQLCTTIKKQLYVACRMFTFDPNSDTLWVNFVNAIRPTLEAMKADQGIRDYKILKAVTDKKATLKAKIRIIPIEAVEDFDLEVSLEDSFGETAAVITE